MVLSPHIERMKCDFGKMNEFELVDEDYKNVEDMKEN